MYSRPLNLLKKVHCMWHFTVGGDQTHKHLVEWSCSSLFFWKCRTGKLRCRPLHFQKNLIQYWFAETMEPYLTWEFTLCGGFSLWTESRGRAVSLLLTLCHVCCACKTAPIIMYHKPPRRLRSKRFATSGQYDRPLTIKDNGSIHLLDCKCLTWYRLHPQPKKMTNYMCYFTHFCKTFTVCCQSLSVSFPAICYLLVQQSTCG